MHWVLLAEAAKTTVEGTGGPGVGATAGFEALYLLLLIGGGAIAAAVVALIVKVMGLMGIKVSEERRKQLNALVDKAIDGTEAWAKKKADAGKKQNSDAKLVKTLATAEKLLVATGADKKLAEKLEHLVEERLHARGFTDPNVAIPGSASDPTNPAEE
jgi:hypothetical protein